MTERAEALLADLPPYLSDEPLVRQYVQALANEMDRMSAYIDKFRVGMLPHALDDQYRFLSMWEKLLGLPVAPAGASLEERRNQVRGAVLARKAASGQEWVSLVTTALGTTLWSYEEGPGPYQVVLTFPWSEGGYSVGTVLALARKVTPAHLQLNATYEGGFIVGTNFTDPAGSVVNEGLI